MSSVISEEYQAVVHHLQAGDGRTLRAGMQILHEDGSRCGSVRRPEFVAVDSVIGHKVELAVEHGSDTNCPNRFDLHGAAGCTVGFPEFIAGSTTCEVELTGGLKHRVGPQERGEDTGETLCTGFRAVCFPEASAVVRVFGGEVKRSLEFDKLCVSDGTGGVDIANQRCAGISAIGFPESVSAGTCRAEKDDVVLQGREVGG